MGKVYGKNASNSTQLIIDGDAIDQRLSTLEANWDSIYQVLTLDELTTPIINGTSRYIAEFPVDIPDGYAPVGIRTLSISSQNSAVVLASYNFTTDTILRIAIRNTSTTPMAVSVNVRISLLKVG